MKITISVSTTQCSLKQPNLGVVAWRYVGAAVVTVTAAAMATPAAASAVETDKPGSVKIMRAIYSTPISMPSVLSSRAILSSGSKQTSVLLEATSTFLPLSLLSQSASAPFTHNHSDRLPNACRRDSTSFCYDYQSGRAVFAQSRQYMPDVPGLRAEGMALKRDRIAMRYSFY